jgi:hypothetical protein
MMKKKLRFNYSFVDTHNDFILLEGLSGVSDCMSVVS